MFEIIILYKITACFSCYYFTISQHVLVIINILFSSSSCYGLELYIAPLIIAIHMHLLRDKELILRSEYGRASRSQDSYPASISRASQTPGTRIERAPPAHVLFCGGCKPQ